MGLESFDTIPSSWYYGPIYHGSEDSVDEDTFYVFKTWPSGKQCLMFCKGTTDDRNCIYINEEGIVSRSFKGPPDEIQNEILDTFHLHKQIFSIPISQRIHRIVAPKVVKAVHYILIRIAPHCTEGKQTLKEVLKRCKLPEMIEFIRTVNFSKISSMNSDELKVFSS